MGSENWVAKLSGKYGAAVGAKPVMFAIVPFCTLAIFFPLGFLMPLLTGRERGLMSELELEQEWSRSGGKLSEDLKTFYAKKDDIWTDLEKQHLAVYSMRGDNAGDDLSLQDVLEEMLLDLKFYASLEVTTSKGNTYTTWDLCSNSISPHNPDKTKHINFPCVIATPLGCFKEYGEVLPPDYAAWIEPTIQPGGLLLNYLDRPSFRNSTAEEIKAILSDGCFANNNQVHYAANILLGKFKYKDNATTAYGNPVLSKIGAMRSTIFTDAQGPLGLKLSLSQPEKADYDESLAGINLHSRKLQDHIVGTDEAHKVLDKSILAVNFGERLKQDMSAFQWAPMVASSMLSVSWAMFASKSTKYPFESRCTMAFLGMQLVGFALMWAISAYLAIGSWLSGIQLGCVPMIQLGLGADDMFVLLHTYTLLGENFIRQNSNAEVISALFKRAGPGVLLTSVCNGLAFLAGTFIPVQGLANICLLLLFCVVGNVFFLSTAFLACLCYESHRIRMNKPDLFIAPLHTTAIANGTASKPTDARDLQDKVQTFLQSKLVAFCDAPAVKVGNILFALVLLALGLLSVVFLLEPGWSPADLVPGSNPAKKAFAMTFNFFQTFPTFWFHDNTDLNKYREEVLEVYHALTSTEFTAPFIGPPWFSMAGALMAMMWQGNFPAQLFNQAGTLPKGIIEDNDWTTTTADLGCLPDFAWNHSLMGSLVAPAGLMSPAERADTWWMCYHMIADVPPSPEKALELTNWFVENTGSGAFFDFFHAFGHNYFKWDEKTGAPTWSYMLMWSVNTKTDNDMITLIEDTDAILEASPFYENTFLYSPLTVLWRAFIGLDQLLWILIGISLGIIAVVVSVMLTSPSAAIIGTLISAMIVIDVWGIICALKPFLKFNPFVVSLCVAAGGLSVEFVSHTIAAFTQGKGSGRARLANAIKDTFIPLINGSISTCLSTIPLLFSHIEFLPKYFFLILQVIVVVGFLHGFLFLPSMLLAMENIRGAKPEEEPVESPSEAPGEVLPTMLTGQTQTPAEKPKESAEKTEETPTADTVV